MPFDQAAAYEAYLARFHARFGDKPDGAYVRLGHYMVQKLAPAEFEARVESYVRWHAACARLVGSANTISDALVLEYEEAAAWLALEAPKLIEMMAGQLPDVDAELARTTV